MLTIKGQQVVLLFKDIYKNVVHSKCTWLMSICYILDSGSSQMGKKESLEDTADTYAMRCIEYRDLSRKKFNKLAVILVFVWNGLTDL